MIKLTILRNKKAAAVMLFSLLLAVAGCDAPGNTPPPAKPPAATEDDKPQPTGTENEKPQPKEAEVILYYPNEDGSKLVAVRRTVKIGEGKDKYTAAIESLMSEPQGQFTVIPQKTKLNSVTVKNGTARIDFSAELRKNFVGGSTGEEMLIGSVVDTLTEFPEVKAVEFLIDGKKIDTISGHSDLSTAIQRMPELIE